VKPPPAVPSDTASAKARAFAVLCGEIVEVSRHMTELFGELIGILGESAVTELVTEQVPDGPKLSEFSLPYFFDEIDSWSVSKKES
jgi:hypothetical protein